MSDMRRREFVALLGGAAAVFGQRIEVLAAGSSHDIDRAFTARDGGAARCSASSTPPAMPSVIPGSRCNDRIAPKADKANRTYASVKNCEALIVSRAHPPRVVVRSVGRFPMQHHSRVVARPRLPCVVNHHRPPTFTPQKLPKAAGRQLHSQCNSLKSLALPRGLEPLFSP